MGVDKPGERAKTIVDDVDKESKNSRKTNTYSLMHRVIHKLTPKLPTAACGRDVDKKKRGGKREEGKRRAGEWTEKRVCDMINP